MTKPLTSKRRCALAAGGARQRCPSRAGRRCSSHGLRRNAMRRFTIAPERRSADRVTFDRDESHHLARVLRLKAGDTVTAVDGSGREFTVRLDVVSHEATGTIVGITAHDTESPFPITLV